MTDISILRSDIDSLNSNIASAMIGLRRIHEFLNSSEMYLACHWLTACNRMQENRTYMISTILYKYRYAAVPMSQKSMINDHMEAPNLNALDSGYLARAFVCKKIEELLGQPCIEFISSTVQQMVHLQIGICRTAVKLSFRRLMKASVKCSR